MKKKLAVVFLVMVLIAMLGGCQKKTEKQFFVGLAFGGLDATPTVLMNYLTAEMDKLGWKYVVTNGDLDFNKYIADLENLCQQAPDLILTRPVNDLANVNAVEICNRYNIPVVIMSSMTVVPDQKYLGHVADPELVRGIPLANWIDAYCDANPGFVPKIGFLVGAIGIDQRGICERSINIRDYLKHEWVDVVTQEGIPNWMASGGMSVTEDWIQAYSLDQLNTLLVWSDEICVGVVQALQAAGKNPDDYLVLSYDGLPLIEDYVAQGWVDATSGLGLKKQSQIIIELAQKVKDGKSSEIDFMTYAHGIYVMDTANIAGLKAGQDPQYWDYSSYIK
ncbi:D-ribose ABC transporter substrate-binding protein [Spirochaetia bacterium]|nr:D-ribose ABC transporter substrate-binding protein [Spirochaetia bacterium]